MSGCERGWPGYPFYPYPSPHQAQWSHHPAAVDYCGGVVPANTHHHNPINNNNNNTQQHHHYVGYNDNHHHHTGFIGSVIPSCPPHYWDGDNLVDAFGCIVKRKTSSANKKERRRTESINNAFAELRECIPNVPADTKLSKIKTLRLATSYIAYLMGVLRTDAQDQPNEAFRAELPPKRKHNPDAEKEESSSDMEGDAGLSYSDESPTSSFQYPSLTQSPSSSLMTSSLTAIGATLSTSPALSGSSYSSSTDRRKSRTGWPEAVWAKELKF